ncbi:MAG: FAD-dependent oxidoreductase [Burkholderiales bacterium]
MRHRFDLVVIGTGTAAGVVAHKCRRAGWSVAVIDSRPFGGTCALRGCDPKKVLVGAAEAVDQVNRLQAKGVRADALRVEWSELMRFKRAMIEAVPGQREDGFARAGIATFHGRAHFEGPTAIRVGDHVLEGRYVLIAAGAKPADLGIAALAPVANQGNERRCQSERFCLRGNPSAHHGSPSSGPSATVSVYGVATELNVAPKEMR